MESLRHADAGSYAHAINHAAHVYNFSLLMNFTEQETTDAYCAALLHDIGKLYFLDLIKLPRRLTVEEKKSLDNHSILSYLILSSYKYSNIVRYSGLFHHYNNKTKFGYPKIDAELTKNIASVAKLYNLAIPTESTTDFSDITAREWKILNIITLLDTLDAAIDPNRCYKKAISLNEIKNDFHTNACNWETLYDKSLQKLFEAYIDWLQEILSS
jgi:HD-GYP domain-containing protein (c-di-GMP phosphodiesterase class II)